MPEEQPFTQQPSPLIISLPLSTLLDYLLTYRTDPLGIHGRFAAIDVETAKSVKLLDPAETLCHVELGERVGTVWPIKLWRESEEKRELSKQRSEKSRANREVLDAARQTMIANVTADPMFGNILEREQIVAFVEKIITGRKFADAKMWGVPNLQELLDT
jgi:hypothetical protein